MKLGSGLGSFVDRLEVAAEIPYAEIAGCLHRRCPPLRRFVFGSLGGA
ncbi:MAG: hypothetical protein R3F11_24075 [Verrucomicrobiales bacterium]